MALLTLAWSVRLVLAGSVPLVSLDLEVPHAAVPGDVMELDSSEEAVSLLQVHAYSPTLDDRFRVPFQVHSAPPSASPLPSSKRVVWITSFPRSGSSLLLNLVVQVNFAVFSIFEPCGAKDSLEPWLAEQGCGALLSQLAQCNFTGVTQLQGWNHGQTLKNGAGEVYSPKSASAACQSAGLVALKTVTWGHEVAKETIPFLAANPHVQAINIVRDPRSIYASMHQAGGFFGPKGRVPEPGELTHICDGMSDGLNASHTRLLRVVYEDLIREPDQAIENISSFIAIPVEVGAYNHTDFMDWSFNNEDCDDGDSYMPCSSNSSAPLERYRMLGPRFYNAFSESPSCRAISSFYGYDPWYGSLEPEGEPKTY